MLQCLTALKHPQLGGCTKQIIKYENQTHLNTTWHFSIHCRILYIEDYEDICIHQIILQYSQKNPQQHKTNTHALTALGIILRRTLVLHHITM